MSEPESWESLPESLKARLRTLKTKVAARVKTAMERARAEQRVRTLMPSPSRATSKARLKGGAK